jgi:multidrug efflux system membrane fusion protein
MTRSAPQSRLARTGVLAILLLGATLGVLAWLHDGPAPHAAAARGPGAVPVSVAAVVARTMPVRLAAIGNVEAYTSVAVKARVDGEIVAVHFHEGDRVTRGAVLFEIDPRPFAATAEQAQANLAKDQAQLARARTQDARNLDLLRQGFISKDAYEQSRTNVATTAAAVKADEAAADLARLELAYCTIRAPITGYAGRILIQQGNLVKANDTNPLVTLNQVQPVYVSFSVPERELTAIRSRQAAGELVVEGSLPAGGHAPVDGRLTFIDNAADTTTGTIRLKATFANADHALWPGQFVNVALTLYQQQGAIVVPAPALQNGPTGQYVFVVAPDRSVALRDVKVDRTQGDEAVIAQGLKPGEVVVTAGQLRLAPGVHVGVEANGKAG